MLAVALFSLAAVRSIEMQVAMNAPGASTPLCGMMAMGHAAHQETAPHQKGAVACAFCAAAAHAPIGAAPPAVRASSTIAWASYATLTPLGPRGPPSITARSRGPPRFPLTV
jgi:hypothetical protein